jgi:apolipoprotein N-acyltransferase
MKDITISAKRMRQEFINLLVCFSIGFVINAIAVFWYGTTWSELFTSLHYVILFAIFIYAIWSGIRLVYFLLKKYFPKKKNNTVEPNLNQ